ncbi:MAG: hypothetical protein ABTQ27_10565, partial [Amaricoccus sp.]|uniref:hypothetical protein n=1 Tax=Amaricoccus sp. TaxID=1872485 RepID=UPI003314F8F2
MYEISVMVGLALGALAIFLLAVALARRTRARSLAKSLARGERRAAGGREEEAGGSASDPMTRRLELRLDEIEARIEAGIEAQAGGGEERLRAMADSLVGLIRDKNATLETALAGLDQLRARLRALEQMGDLAEARGLFERLETRIDELRASQASQAVAFEERVAGLAVRAEAEAAPQAALAEQFSRLYARKDEGIAAMLARLAPFEARLAEIETARATEGQGRETLTRLEARIETLRGAQEAGQVELTALRTELRTELGAGPVAAIAERLGGLHAQKEALVETLLTRIATLEETQAMRDPRAALDRFAERLEAIQTRVATLETPGESPFAEISEQLTRLYAQKDASVEAVFARLAPLEARLAEMETGLAAQDPRVALDRFAERLEAAQAARLEAEGSLRDRITALETPGENPFAEISAQLTRLYAQKDASVETVFARLAPLEARLAEVEAGLAAQDPRVALDRIAERLETAQAARLEAEGALRDRLLALEAPAENPFAEISEQLVRLYAQKDATVETVFARLAPLEARLEEVEAGLSAQDPRGALDRFAERLEAAQARLLALEAADRSPFAEISEQLTRLYAQKDANLEAVQARLAPLETRLRDMEADIAARDPRAVLDAFAARLDAAQAVRAAAEASLRDRIAALEAPGENPFAEISEQLTRLYAQKDATVETVFARLAPLEARLEEMAADLATQDPRVALDRFAERLEAAQARITVLEAPGENPFADISEQLTRLYAQKDATVETVFARLAPLEARLEEMAADLAAQDPRVALDRFAERLEAAQAARLEAEGALRDRLSALEAPGENPFAEISERLTRLYAQKDATVETVFARLAPLEARLVEMETGLAAQDPRVALDRFAERLEAAQGRIAALEAPAEDPLADLSAELGRLHAEKDASVETVFARLAPLEAR